MKNTDTPVEGNKLPKELITPIKRTDEKAAKAFLRWLIGSPFAFHIDDNPVDCGIPRIPARALKARRDEAVFCLGYVRAWEVYNPCPSDEPAPSTLLDAAKTILACVDKPGATVRSITGESVGQLRKAVAAEEAKQ